MKLGSLPEIGKDVKNPKHVAEEASSEALKLMRSKRMFYSVMTALGTIALIGIVLYLLEILAIPMGIIIWSVIIVFCLRGIVNSLEERGVPRGGGAAIAYVVMFLVIALIVWIMCSPAFGIGDQFMNLLQATPGYIQQFADWGNSVYMKYQDVLDNEAMRQYATDALASLGALAQEMLKGSASGFIELGNGIANSAVVIGFALVVAFWFLMELPAMGREFRRIVNPKYKEDLELLHLTLTNVLGGYIKATLIQCAIIGGACLVLFMIVGIPNFAALGVITGILNIIPVVGPWLGGAFAAVIALFISPLHALIVLIGTIIIQQFVYTFISPKLMASSVDVHPALTLICLMAGSALGGAMGGLAGSIFGMLISIPAVAVAKAVFVYYFEKGTGRQIVAEDGVFFKGTPAEGDEMDPMADAMSPHPGSTAKFAPIDISKVEERVTEKMKIMKDHDQEGKK